MREILFRGKQTYNGEWVEGFFCNETCELPLTLVIEQANIIEKGTGWWREVIPETVGQYTGLTDKNGKKIFEGDIIKAMMDYGPAGFYERIVPIKWLDNVGYQWQYFDISTIEVIGNIHDNKLEDFENGC